MSSLALPSSPLLNFWRNISSRVRFKFVLPHVRYAMLEGVKLNIALLSPMMKNIILTGRYEVQERRLAAAALTRNDVVLELGGAIGFVGLFCRKVIGVSHVTSVEANPATMDQLIANYALNGLKPHVIHAAAAGENGFIDLNIGGEFWENSITSSSSNTVRVPARSLQSLVAAMPQSPTVLICDIEGAEQHLDFSQLPASVRQVIMELHPGMIGETATNEVIAKLRRCGFEAVKQEEDVVRFVRQ